MYVYIYIFIYIYVFNCGDSCLDEHLFEVWRLSIYAKSCAAEQVFGRRHVAVAFPFFHNSFVSGDNGRMVCLYERLAVR